jgi:hypothetical protein
LRGMLAIQSVLDILVDIDLVDYLVGIVLESCGENDNLEELGHQLDEVHAARAHQEVAIASIFNIVDQGLIEI